MIELIGLTKVYGLYPVLRGVDLHIQAGEFVTLVGPNGAGKTTLLRIVASLLQPTTGVVRVGGWQLPGQAERVRQHIALVSHQPMLYGDLTASENLRFYARLYGLGDAAERVEELLKFVGLWARRHDFVRTFSRGMWQRLTIARATLHNPEVLLLDEPYTGLDPTAVQLLDHLLAQQAELGRTILMITHDLVHGLSLCDRVALLQRGKITAELPSNELTPAKLLQMYQGQPHG